MRLPGRPDSTDVRPPAPTIVPVTSHRKRAVYFDFGSVIGPAGFDNGRWPGLLGESRRVR